MHDIRKENVSQSSTRVGLIRFRIRVKSAYLDSMQKYHIPWRIPMSSTRDSTPLVCLSQHNDQAQASLNDIEQVGIASDTESSFFGLASDDVPAHSFKHLQSGIQEGGTVSAVSALDQQIGAVRHGFPERVHQATETGVGRESMPVAVMGAAAVPISSEIVIPIVEEHLEVGKRAVDRGGVRVLRRVIENPVEASIILRKKHVVIERRAVTRPATDADLKFHGNHSIEFIETEEEAVVSKLAHVVEEVVVGKQVEERTEHIQGSARRTEVEVELIGVDKPHRSGNQLR
ncbi:MAG: YsnF/AvaK domain-containing protein [Janthinobacterium lividum]